MHADLREQPSKRYLPHDSPNGVDRLQVDQFVAVEAQFIRETRDVCIVFVLCQPAAALPWRNALTDVCLVQILYPVDHECIRHNQHVQLEDQLPLLRRVIIRKPVIPVLCALRHDGRHD